MGGAWSRLGGREREKVVQAGGERGKRCKLRAEVEKGGGSKGREEMAEQRRSGEEQKGRRGGESRGERRERRDECEGARGGRRGQREGAAC